MTDPLRARLEAIGRSIGARDPLDVRTLRFLLNPDASPADKDGTGPGWVFPELRTAARDVGAKWRCRQCSAFVRGESSSCAKCRDRGPHHFGEDAPTTGNYERRARLRAAQKRRRRTIR